MFQEKPIKQQSVSSVLKDLPEDGWFEASCGDGAKGARTYDWMIVSINQGPTPGFERSLLIRTSKSTPDEFNVYICFAPVNATRQILAEIAGSRWRIETCFKESKSQVRLDQYEIRSFEEWYKHITFACISLAFLTFTVLSAHSLDTKTFQEHNPTSQLLKPLKRGAICSSKQE